MQYRNILIVSVACLVLMTAVFATGCTGTPSEAVPQGPGISNHTPDDVVRQVSLMEALDALKTAGINGTNNQSTLHIYYIRGETLDIDGSAKDWAIGAEQDSKPFFFIYDAKGTQVMDWPGGFSGPEIDTAKIMSPEDLFKGHQLFMQNLTDNGTMTVDALEVRGEKYTLTVQLNGSTTDYLFNAMTGKEIES